ncbi:SLBB domain-containing protein, partial [Sulfuricurvum sp.]|uniref:SLBB domain-containing protein n=1 Tax=Sulfuricurvum sp. TaxID=2025608 RepID=UPI003BB777A1
VYIHDLDKSNLRGITLYGNVVKPGFWPLIQEGIQIKEFFQREITQNTLRGVFLEDTYFDYAIIKRTNANLKEELIGFSLQDTLSGKEKIALKNRDELFILNQTMVAEKPVVRISGECVTRPGEYKFFDKMTLEALLGTAGMNCLIDRSKITIISKEQKNHRQVVKTVDMTMTPNIALNVFDEVKVMGFYTLNPMKKATINGEVYAPGEYPIGDGEFSLQKLIQAAGGLTDKASNEKIEIVRYSIVNGIRTREVKEITMSDVMGERSPLLTNYDEVTIFKVAQWNERKSVKIQGKVKYPGEYPIEDGDTLSDLLKRVGGFTDAAYVQGAVFTREELKLRQREGVERQIKDLEQRIMFIATQPTEAGQNAGDKAQLVTMLETLKAEVKKTQFVGRLAINLQNDIRRFEGSSSDILLKNGDALYVPEREDSVMVQGQVLNPNAIVYNAELTLDDYLAKAGGLKESADEKNIFVVHANGEAEGFKTSYLLGSSTKVGPGDVIIVPMYISTYSGMQLAKDITAILYQLAVSVAALDTIGAL